MRVYLVLTIEYYDDNTYDIFPSEIEVYDTMDKANARVRENVADLPSGYTTEERIGRISGRLSIVVYNEKGKRNSRVFVVGREVI